MTSKHRPLKDFIVIRPELSPEVLASGLHVPQVARKATCIGEVIATGPGRRVPRERVLPSLDGSRWVGGRLPELRLPGVERGEWVAYDKRSAVEVEWEGEKEKCHMVTSEALYFIIDDDEGLEVGDPAILRADVV